MRRRVCSLSCLSTLFLGSLLTTLTWHTIDKMNVMLPQNVPQTYDAPSLTREAPFLLHDAFGQTPEPLAYCEQCSAAIRNAMKSYYQPWMKHEGNHLNFTSQLSRKCKGSDTSILTKANTQVGATIVYSGKRKKKTKMKGHVFKTLPMENPFLNKTWDTCAVVGNSGILQGSRCGTEIDLAHFVIRCNLAPLRKEFVEDVGRRTDLVTANPSILTQRFQNLHRLRRPFVEGLQVYGSSLLALPNYSFVTNTPVCERVIFSIHDFNSRIKPVVFNPDYLYRLHNFWASRGLQEPRLTTGFIMVNLALELCRNVHLYGFWPHKMNPYNLKNLTNHYYDNVPATGHHDMPAEFRHLLELHNQGVLRIHLKNCRPEGEEELVDERRHG